jgi:hypothetical protein
MSLEIIHPENTMIKAPTPDWLIGDWYGHSKGSTSDLSQRVR